MEQQLNFYTPRTVGQVIAFAFKILKKNIKNNFLGLILIVCPFFACAGILLYKFFADISVNNFGDTDILLVFAGYVLFALGFVMLASYSNATIIAMRDSTDQKPKYSEIVKIAMKHFGINILYSFVIGFIAMFIGFGLVIVFYIFAFIFGLAAISKSVVLIGIGVIILIVGGMLIFSYLISLTAPILFISNYDRVGIFKAIDYNFSFVHKKKNFGPSILVSIFSVILMYIIIVNLFIPVGIVVGVIEYTTGGLYSSDDFLRVYNKWFSIASIVINPFAYYIMHLVINANYINNKENSYGTGLRQRIDKIGQEADYNSSEWKENF